MESVQLPLRKCLSLSLRDTLFDVLRFLFVSLSQSLLDVLSDSIAFLRSHSWIALRIVRISKNYVGMFNIMLGTEV